MKGLEMSRSMKVCEFMKTRWDQALAASHNGQLTLADHTQLWDELYHYARGWEGMEEVVESVFGREEE